jgi:3-oxoacyl-[acyl-carrier protein] reductase
MDGPFSGRVALITGASGGIGQALARRLAAAGAAPGLGYAAHGQAAEALAAEITAAGGKAITIGADLRRPQAGSWSRRPPARWVRWRCWSATPG